MKTEEFRYGMAFKDYYGFIIYPESYFHGHYCANQRFVPSSELTRASEHDFVAKSWANRFALALRYLLVWRNKESSDNAASLLSEWVNFNGGYDEVKKPDITETISWSELVETTDEDEQERAYCGATSNPIANELLQMIMDVDPADTAKLDEIDARVFLYISRDGKYTVEETIRLLDAEYRAFGTMYHRYTRSLDAIEAIIPKGVCTALHYEMTGWEDGETNFVIVDGWNGYSSPKLRCEKLARLYACILYWAQNPEKLNLLRQGASK